MREPLALSRQPLSQVIQPLAEFAEAVLHARLHAPRPARCQVNQPCNQPPQRYLRVEVVELGLPPAGDRLQRLSEVYLAWRARVLEDSSDLVTARPSPRTGRGTGNSVYHLMLGDGLHEVCGLHTGWGDPRDALWKQDSSPSRVTSTLPRRSQIPQATSQFPVPAPSRLGRTPVHLS